MVDQGQAVRQQAAGGRAGGANQDARQLVNQALLVLFDGILWVEWKTGVKDYTLVTSSGDLQWCSSYPVQIRKELLQVAQPLEEELCSLVLIQQTAGFFIQQEAVSSIHHHTPAGPPQPHSSVLSIVFLLLILLNRLQREEDFGLVLVQFCRAAEQLHSV